MKHPYRLGAVDDVFNANVAALRDAMHFAGFADHLLHLRIPSAVTLLQESQQIGFQIDGNQIARLQSGVSVRRRWRRRRRHRSSRLRFDHGGLRMRTSQHGKMIPVIRSTFAGFDALEIDLRTSIHVYPEHLIAANTFPR